VEGVVIVGSILLAFDILDAAPMYLP